MRSPHPATCCFTSAPSAWISASSSLPRSWHGLGTRFRPSTKCTDLDISMIAILSDLSTERKIRRSSRTRRRTRRLEDAEFAAGSYVVVQKYSHDLAGWNALSTEAQERIIGRTKLSDIELDDAVKPTCAHNALTTIVEDGKEVKILRDNMPFGSAAKAEFGTYFIGYARSPERSSKCWKICSLAGLLATTIGCWISAAL